MTIRCCLLTVSFAAAAAAQTAAPASPAPSNAESMRLQYANGIVAVAEDKIITVADVMHEIGPYMQQLREEARSEREYAESLERLQDSAIQDLIDRVLIIKEFRKDDKRHIPASFIDNAVSDDIADRFEGDRSKFLAYLKLNGKTKLDYRRDKEEEIIYQYMQGEQRRSQSIVSPVRIETYYNENKDRFYREDEIHLRMIQFTRTDETTDESLRHAAALVAMRFKNGEKFEDLAKELSQGSNRSKGGDWGWMQRSGFRPEWSEVAFNLKKGEISEPLIMPEGCYILFAEDRRYAGIKPLDDVRDEIERLLIAQMTRTSQERWLERLRRNGYIKYY